MKVKKGDKVSIEYEGKFENGQIFDTNKHGDHFHLLEILVGSGQVILGLDQALIGMKNGEEKEITIKKEDAYGDYREELKKEIPKEEVYGKQEPKEGMFVIMTAPNGQQTLVRIIKVNKKTIILDLNHPLAGKNLIFKIKVVNIKSNSNK